MLSLPRSLTSFLILLVLPSVFADPATVPYKNCSGQFSNVTEQLNITTVYAQVLPNDAWGKYLNLTLIGESSQEIIGFSNSSNSLCPLHCVGANYGADDIGQQRFSRPHPS